MIADKNQTHLTDAKGSTYLCIIKEDVCLDCCAL